MEAKRLAAAARFKYTMKDTIRFQQQLPALSLTSVRGFIHGRCNHKRGDDNNFFFILLPLRAEARTN